MKTNDQIILEAMASRIRELESEIEKQQVVFDKKITREREVVLVFQQFIGEKHPELSKEFCEFTVDLCTKNPFDFGSPFEVGADALNFEASISVENEHLELAFYEMHRFKSEHESDQ